jgi:hypothetical protein
MRRYDVIRTAVLALGSAVIALAVAACVNIHVASPD